MTHSIQPHSKPYGLVIGIDDYEAAPSLKTARVGAQAVAALLTERLQFGEVITLYDQAATRKTILEKWRALLDKLQPDDRLVFYFAGQGIGVEGETRTESWLIPYEGEPAHFQRLLPLADLVTLGRAPAKNVFIVLDTFHWGNPAAYPLACSILASASPLEAAEDAGLLDNLTPFTAYLLRTLCDEDDFARDPDSGLLTFASVARFVRCSMAIHFEGWAKPEITIPAGDGGVWFAEPSSGLPPRAAHPYTRLAQERVQQAIARFNRQDYDGAIADCSLALEIDPQIGEAWAWRGRAFSRKSTGADKALADSLESVYLGKHPALAVAHNTCGWYLASKGRRAEAIDHFTHAIELGDHPEPHFPYANRGGARHQLGDVDGAIADYTEAIRLGHRQDHYQERANLPEKKGDLAGAAADYTEIIRLAPRTPPPTKSTANCAKSRVILKAPMPISAVASDSAGRRVTNRPR